MRQIGARKAAGGCAPALGCGSPSLREGFPAVLSLMARRETRFTPCGRCAQTVSASQNTKRAARAAMSLALLGAAYVAADAHPPTALPMHRAIRSGARHGGASKAAGGQAGARLEGAEQRSGPRGIATPHRRRRDGEHVEVRAQRRCVSSVAPARGRGAEPPLGSEQRRAPGPSGRAPVGARTGLPTRSLARSDLATEKRAPKGPFTAATTRRQASGISASKQPRAPRPLVLRAQHCHRNLGGVRIGRNAVGVQVLGGLFDLHVAGE